MTQVIIIIVYLLLLLTLGLFSNRFSKGTSRDYFLASHSIGPVLLLMSIFGTTMTAFALVGSTGEAYQLGIGTYGKMASSSALVHSAIFFFIGIPIWKTGKRCGHLTQCAFFRERFESPLLGYLLFPLLVGLVIPYLLVGILGAGMVIQPITVDPEIAWLSEGVPRWITGGVICAVVLLYVFFGGLRGTAWANAFQTAVFMILGVLAVWMIAKELGGATSASEAVLAHPEYAVRLSREDIPPMQFLTYCLIPLAVGMFPHLFQHWLTARSARSFRLTLVAHPLFIAIVWVPCVLIGVWATAAVGADGPIVPPGTKANLVLGIMVNALTSPLISGFLAVGLLAAIMSSLDSQFLCLGTMFTQDIVLNLAGKGRFSDRQKIYLARTFIVLIVAFTYWLSLQDPRQVFRMSIWCFSGFASLFPLIVAALYWRRVTSVAAIATVIVAAVTWFALFYTADFGRSYLLLTSWSLMPVTLMLGVTILTLIVVSLFTAPPSEKTLATYFPEKTS
jgi:SSS family solute:Na+ symporter